MSPADPATAPADVPAVGGAWIERLTLTDFRNHAEATLEAGPGFVVLWGDNGAGKTNILEAVSLLAPGRGLRRAPLSEVARSDGPGRWAVAARLGDGTAIGTGTATGGKDAGEVSGDRRRVRINGAFAPATQLSEHLTVQWLTPAMDRLWVEGAGERRRWLDRLTLALFSDHATNATRYEAAMRERTRLLTGEERPDPAWLSALEVRMAEHGAAVQRARREMVAALAGRLRAAPDDPFARPTLTLEGWEEDGDLARTLAANRARDAAAGRALNGPHRTDLVAAQAGSGHAAAASSTGEQKAMLLGVQLAHAELMAERSGRAPVLLLDEVAAHLDPMRREALFERLAGRGQVWITGTERPLFRGVGKARFIHVSSGNIHHFGC